MVDLIFMVVLFVGTQRTKAGITTHATTWSPIHQVINHDADNPLNFFGR
jgi:hypothetical protein